MGIGILDEWYLVVGVMGAETLKSTCKRIELVWNLRVNSRTCAVGELDLDTSCKCIKPTSTSVWVKKTIHRIAKTKYCDCRRLPCEFTSLGKAAAVSMMGGADPEHIIGLWVLNSWLCCAPLNWMWKFEGLFLWLLVWAGWLKTRGSVPSESTGADVVIITLSHTRVPNYVVVW